MPAEHWQPLSDRQAGLWWLALEDVPADGLSRWTALLDAEEQARAARFVHERDRRSFVAAHALLRIVLQRLAGRPAPTWRFEAGPRGKPALHPDHGLGRLTFNISHTQGAVACAMTLDHAIGVDIEAVDRRVEMLGIARSHFAPAEFALLAAPDADRRDLFFRLWTLKEAYIKAHGDGLALPLQQFAFSLAPLSVAFEPGLRDDPARWQFATLSPTPAHRLSLAVRHGGTPVAVLSYRMTHSVIDRLMTASREET
jgi:4'-phosphopantetheinyl transferase